ncbi:glycosyl transferase [Leptospira perolatii]|uniref:Glycosyl transferase n=1 Tax=Leptospira perolatii TaxID=2023191 RepID=A0A2M9ZKP7_9LEPT|nr:glycosyltransferase [Leptospira perolatii]PJZ69957.1 glycosyl transferase [Leptospira perolatii]PJZ72635.1 glycosyl transferase [Leptospira perolatii]
MKVFQHITEFRDLDGIGNDIKGIRDVLTSINVDSEVVTLKNFSSEPGEIRTIGQPGWEEGFSSNSVHILQYGGAGYPLDTFIDLPGRKFVRFQNVTPARFFRPFVSEDVYRSFEFSSKLSVLELHKLRRYVETFISSSKYSASNLEDLNITNYRVLPIVKKYTWSENRGKKKNRFTIGYVGRISPNKKIEDLLLLLYFLKRINIKYRALICGTIPGIFENYFSVLKRMAWDLGLGESLQFRIGPTEKEIERFWEEMDAYVSMSEHEGFGIPLVEALARDIPVFAYSCTAVAETLKGAGFLFQRKDIQSIQKLAEWIHIILETEGSGKPLPGEHQSSKRKHAVDEYNTIPFGRFFKQILMKNEPGILQN